MYFSDTLNNTDYSSYNVVSIAPIFIAYMLNYYVSLLVLSYCLIFEFNYNKLCITTRPLLVTSLLLISGIPPMPMFMPKISLLIFVANQNNFFIILGLIFCFFSFWLNIFYVIRDVNSKLSFNFGINVNKKNNITIITTTLILTILNYYTLDFILF